VTIVAVLVGGITIGVSVGNAILTTWVTVSSRFSADIVFGKEQADITMKRNSIVARNFKFFTSFS